MAVIFKDLGMVTAYAYAVSKGYTGTEDEFATLMADYTVIGQQAVDAVLEAQRQAGLAAGSAANAEASKDAAIVAKGEAELAKGNAQAAAISASSSEATAIEKAAEAGRSVTDAANSATAAARSASNAHDSADTAHDSEVAAQSYASQAAASSVSASGFADNAEESAGDAADSATAAARSASNAHDSADTAHDSEVAAQSYASQAAASSVSASGFADNAEESAGDAADSAGAAASSASAAASSVQTAAGHAASAAASAVSAENSASAAAESASSALESKNSASQSATAAASSESNAAQSENNASQSATDAANSATAAAGSATNAAQSAQAAQDVLDSIPSDYSSLAAQVTSHSDEIDSLWDAMSFDMTLPTIMANLRHGRVDKVPLGATFTVQHAVYGDITFAVRARNMHKCADDETKPTLTIQPIYLLSNSGGASAATFRFDRAEAFCKVAEDIPAGTVCKFTTIAYGSWLAGTYMFTATSAIPAGSKLCISGAQNTALTSLKVRVYANAKATSHSAEYAINTEDGTATLDLGTWGTDCNHPQRVSYGSNNEAQSNIFQWLNADTGSNNMDSVFVEQTDFDMMDTSFASKKGFLGGFGAEFRSYLGLAKIPNITNLVFESDPYVKNEAYTHQGYFFLPSRKEIYGSNENSYEADESQFDFYKDVMTADADKLMFARGATSPTSYWLRTPDAGSASHVRICYTGHGGALYVNYANSSVAVAPLAILA